MPRGSSFVSSGLHSRWAHFSWARSGRPTRESMGGSRPPARIGRWLPMARILACLRRPIWSSFALSMIIGRFAGSEKSGLRGANRLSVLKRGDVSLIAHVPPDQVASLAKFPDIKVGHYEQPSIHVVAVMGGIQSCVPGNFVAVSHTPSTASVARRKRLEVESK